MIESGTKAHMSPKQCMARLSCGWFIKISWHHGLMSHAAWKAAPP